MAHSRTALSVTTLVMLLLLICSAYFFLDHYLLFSFIVLICTFIPFVVRFELKKLEGREVVLLAVLAAIAAVSRVPFSALPSVQPTTFVIIVSALVFGAESGFMIGATAALVSNLFLGQGPWTPWQMYAWGMIGLTAGLLRNTWFMKRIWGQCIFGFAVGIIFGWVMNAWFIFGVLDDLTWGKLLAYYGASMYFDLAHGVSNVFFLAVFSAGWVKILQRFKRKYGLLS